MNSNVWVLMVSEAVAIATVLTLAALGGLINERAGVINLGTEGMMLVTLALLAVDEIREARA